MRGCARLGATLVILMHNYHAIQESHVKGHIDLAGYKVMTEANSNPGGHGFQIVHEREKAHYFSSNDYRVVKDWMKNIMKATITRDYSGGSLLYVRVSMRSLADRLQHPPSPRRLFM